MHVQWLLAEHAGRPAQPLLEPGLRQVCRHTHQSVLESPYFKHLDQKSGGALTRDIHLDQAAAGAHLPSSVGAVAQRAADEVHCGKGDHVTLLGATFVDGVQMHNGSKYTTTALSIKFMDLPAHLVQTLAASYNVAFISGPKEPSDLTSFMKHLLAQLEDAAPETVTAHAASDGESGEPSPEQPGAWHCL